jgi:hypothetical protein
MDAIREYLDAANAAPICILWRDPGYGYAVGWSRVESASSVHWVNRKLAVKVARYARRTAGAKPDKATAELALQCAASHYGVRLTPHLIAVSRAKIAAAKLTFFLDAIQASGGLADFNRAYKRKRMAATARGEGFMGYKTAMMRLRRAVIVMLIEKRPLREAQPVFDSVLDRNGTSTARGPKELA